MRKNNGTTWGKKQEGSGERRETIEISTKGKTIQTKQDIPKQRKNVHQQLGGHDTKTYKQSDARETERFFTKIWQPERHKEKAEWINDMRREIEGHEEGPKAQIHIELLEKTLKKISN